MYASGTDSLPETNEVAVTVAIPTRFVWPYGGTRVFLSGSFTRWSEHVPMSPMEGCPTVFQAICSLTPGYHQYKFFVDGEWRHDENQPFVTGNYGTVNTVLLTREPDPNTAILFPETPGSRSNMDVDTDTFYRVVTLSDGTLQKAVPRFAENDLEVSRHRISAFLSTHEAFELLPESGKIITLDVDVPVKQAFHILYEQGIPMAPLWDFCKGQVVGVLTPLDFILILRELGKHGSNLTEEELETHTISAWKEAGPFDSLKDVALKILQNKLSTVPLTHRGSYPELLHLASLSGILKCICRHFRHSSSSLPILQQPICSIPLGTWVPRVGELNGRPLAVLRPNASLNSALSLLVQAQVSSIPIVDENDSLLDIYSRSDITALAKDRAYAQIQLDEMSIHQALQLGQDASSPHTFFNAQRCQMCIEVMERLANPGVRRLVIVEAGSKRVEGIISLSDVFRLLLG
ncbi:sucrose nonfermenting 4-like protein isoform X3 [Telopea speciosissima]|uniref:sucrose nonfermenting 4-like protein isoform X3 n=1 Tax=Telopea speciosissima TaxID=54955 RepID=UPI001CC72B5C|nr:sucrose nonfermenting 4-like protein isoform X3 [Telopea speciosissima]